jgi:(S)-ureidoglycine aminohydrolase
MQKLGFTRSGYHRDHLLQTPDTFVRAPLPGMEKGTAIVHVRPALGAAFTQYTAELEAGGSLGSCAAQRFLYVITGAVEVGGKTLGVDGYAYLPVGEERVSSGGGARVTVIEKEYVGTDGTRSKISGHTGVTMVLGNEREVAPRPLMDDPDIAVRVLIPEDPVYDFAVNSMTFQPGASLPMVEIHVMEHGLVMLAGGGIYRLGEQWHSVTAGDFIWMAPYCPQWFGAIGKTPAKYLLYKDWNR